MAWNARILQTRPSAFFGEDIAVANAASLHLDANLAGAGRRNFALYDFKISLGFGNLYHFHFCHGADSPSREMDAARALDATLGLLDTYSLRPADFAAKARGQVA
jgi:hypothetical protein